MMNDRQFRLAEKCMTGARVMYAGVRYWAEWPRNSGIKPKLVKQSTVLPMIDAGWLALDPKHSLSGYGLTSAGRKAAERKRVRP